MQTQTRNWKNLNCSSSHLSTANCNLFVMYESNFACLVGTSQDTSQKRCFTITPWPLWRFLKTIYSLLFHNQPTSLECKLSCDEKQSKTLMNEASVTESGVFHFLKWAPSKTIFVWRSWEQVHNFHINDKKWLYQRNKKYSCVVFLLWDNLQYFQKSMWSIKKAERHKEHKL